MSCKKTTGTQCKSGHGGENGSDTLKMMPGAESTNSEPDGEERLCTLKRESLSSPNNKQKKKRKLLHPVHQGPDLAISIIYQHFHPSWYTVAMKQLRI